MAAARILAGPAEGPLLKEPGPLGRLRLPVRRSFLNTLRRALLTPEGREALHESLGAAAEPWPGALSELDLAETPPYEDLRSGGRGSELEAARRPVFVTSRFRAGSTLIWNLFRSLEGCTSYYEPFNERRWFDRASRGRRIDPSHRGVADYWREYDGLDDLASLYDVEWTRRRLLMGPAARDHGMRRYIARLIEAAPGRPILQFNRIDFRLPWIRQQFPTATLVHLYRHPRDQWCSSLPALDSAPAHSTMESFATADGFYLRTWATDLAYHFPFLDPSSVGHPYRLFYFLWRLSYLFGRRWADLSVGFEDLVGDPLRELNRLFHALGVGGEPSDALLSLIDPPAAGRWTEYADADWFQGHEDECEAVIERFLGAGSSPRRR